MPAPTQLRAWLQGTDEAFVVVTRRAIAAAPPKVVLDARSRPLRLIALDQGWASQLTQARRSALLQAADATLDIHSAARLGIPALREADLHRELKKDILAASAAASRLASLPDEPPPPDWSRIRLETRPRTVLVASHDLKFAQPILEGLRADGHRVLIDEWNGHSRHDSGRSTELLREAHVVFCEWGLGNAVWYTKNAPSDVPVVVRVHAQELRTWTLAAMRPPATLIAVGPYIARQVIRSTGWNPNSVRVVPNAVTLPENRHAKPASSRFALGVVGISPRMKRLDLALDVLQELRRKDDRFVLHVKGHRPEELDWVWQLEDERRYYEALYTRIENDPALHDAVHFDGFDADLTSWWAGIGHALSMSDHESFHFTLPDGAANRAVPTSLPWKGADELYPKSWVVPSTRDMAERIFRLAGAPELWGDEASRSHDYVRERFEQSRIVEQLKNLILSARADASPKRRS